MNIKPARAKEIITPRSNKFKPTKSTKPPSRLLSRTFYPEKQPWKRQQRIDGLAAWPSSPQAITQSEQINKNPASWASSATLHNCTLCISFFLVSADSRAYLENTLFCVLLLLLRPPFLRLKLAKYPVSSKRRIIWEFLNTWASPAVLKKTRV